MAEQVVAFFEQFGISKEVIVFFVSLLPVLELRGGLVAAALLKVDAAPAAVICYVGNILPIPFILLFINKIFDLLRRFEFFRKLIFRIERSAMKRSDRIKKAAWLGLFIFVGIPLPGTGAWTGALISVLLGLETKRSFAAIAAGALLAEGIMLTFTYFVPGLFF